MQAFRVVNPFCPDFPHSPLPIYRVKWEFQIGSVTWPIGAIRIWTTVELDEFKRMLVVTKTVSDEAELENFFRKHFEQIEFRYPEA